MTQNQTTTPEDLAPPLDEETTARGAADVEGVPLVADAGVASHASSPTKFGSLLERLEAAVASSEKAAAELELASCSRAAPSQASSRRAGAKKHGSVRDSPITRQEAPTSSTQGIARETPDVSTGGPQEAPGAASLQQQAVVSPTEPATRKRRLSKTPSQPSAEESEGVRAEVPSVSSSMPAPTTAEPLIRRKLVKTVVLPSVDAACAKTVEEPLAAPVEPPSKRPTRSKRLGALQLVNTVVRTSIDDGVDAACAKKPEEPLAAPVEPPSKRPTRSKKLEALQLVTTVVPPSVDEGVDAACANTVEEPLAAPVEPPSKRPRRSKRVEALLAMGKRERQRYVSQLSDRQQVALTMQLSLCEGGA